MCSRAFSLESRGTLPPHEDPLEQLLGAPRAPGGSWYASCVLQRSRRALSEFLSQALPKGVPHFLQRREEEESPLPLDQAGDRRVFPTMWRLTSICAGMAILSSTQAAICGNYDAATCDSMNDGGCDCAWSSNTCIKTDNCTGVGITSVDDMNETNTSTTVGQTAVGAAWIPCAFGLAPVWLMRLLSPKSLASRCRPPTHSAAAWVFFGRNARGRVLRGRPEHTDAIQHSGTWHVQLKGQKVWTVRPTTELQRQARALKGAGPVKIRCKEGDVLCINTKLWWHQTHIPSKCQLSMSVARDMYLDGTRPGHYAVQAIRKGAVIFTEDDAPDLQLPRNRPAPESTGPEIEPKKKRRKGEKKPELASPAEKENMNDSIRRLYSQSTANDASLGAKAERLGQDPQSVRKAREKASMAAARREQGWSDPKAQSSFQPEDRPEERLEDLGGVDDILQDLRQLVVQPLSHPEVFSHLGVQPPTGVLLFGPPGCGKTKIAHAIAGTTGVPFFKIAATEIVSGMSGESEAKIRQLFQAATSAAPSLIFMDEVDAITPKRDSAGREMERRIVAQLLTSLDEIQKSNVIVLAATNRPDALDPALRRAGRFDREIAMGIPDEAARAKILEKMVQGMRLAESLDLKFLAKKTAGFVGADLSALTKEAALGAVERAFKGLAALARDSEGSDKAYTAEEMSTLAIEAQDFTEALSKVQPSARREGFTTIPDVKWEDVATHPKGMQAKDTCGVDFYPPPPIKWHPTVEQHESMIDEAEQRGLWNKQPKPTMQKHSRGSSDATTKIGSQDEEMHILVKGAMALEPPNEAVRAYRATAFYQSEGFEPRERRKSETYEARGRNRPKPEYFLPLGAAESPTLDGFILGSFAEVFSAKAQRWMLGEVTRLDLGRSELTVEYEGRVKTVNLAASELHTYFRKCESKVQIAGEAPMAQIQRLGTDVLPPTLPSAHAVVVGLTVPVGVLLFGPPGCGKTLLAKATANQSGANFIAVKEWARKRQGPELLNKYVGESERAVRLVFQRARSSAPCVIFFDELDALVPRRSSEGNGSSERVVNQMLTEMDGVQSRSQVFVIAATNRPDIVDPAMLRPGRLEILRTHMRKLPLAADVDLSRFAEEAEGFSGADLASLAREAAMQAIRRAAASPTRETSDAQDGTGRGRSTKSWRIDSVDGDRRRSDRTSRMRRRRTRDAAEQRAPAQEVQRSGPGVGSQNMAKTVKFEGVGMTCSGCSGAIERILKKVDGVASISCDIDGKTVTVEYDDAKTKPQEMWDKMKKWADAAQKELAPCPE
eukprot:g20986.t3